MSDDVKIYTLATYDNSGIHADVFATEIARDDALLAWIGSNRKDWASSRFADDLQGFVRSNTSYPGTFFTGEQDIITYRLV